jgi:hypothetical protein
MVLALAYAGAALSRTRLAGGGKERKRLIQRGTRLDLQGVDELEFSE